MARLPDVIVDPAPLTDPGLDVRLRVGWLLRTARLNAPASEGLRGNAVAQEIGVNAALVTRWEKGTEDVDQVGIEAYERITALPPGTLRGPIHMVRRMWRHEVSGRSTAAEADIDRLSSLVWPAMHGEPRGVEWLNFADVLRADGSLTLPDFTAGPVVSRLAGELSRSVGSAFQTRYEALSRLRSGRYGTVALRAMLGVALADDAQLGAYLLRACAEQPSAQLVADMCRLLSDPRTAVFEGACRALDQMLTPALVSTADLRAALPRLTLAYDIGAADPERHARLSTVVRLLPDELRAEVVEGLARPLAEVVETPITPTQRSKQYLAAEAVADRVKHRLPTPEDQVLVRVIYEALFDRVTRKRLAARHFLLALPYYDVVQAEVDRLLEHGDPDVRRAAIDLTLKLGTPRGLAYAESKALTGTATQRMSSLLALGRWAPDVEPAVLEKAVTDAPELVRHALFAAGMVQSPVLRDWADDPAKSEQVHIGARWWLRNGGRITE